MSDNTDFPANNGNIDSANASQAVGAFPPPLHPGEYIDLSRDEDQARIVIDLTGEDDLMDVDPPQDAVCHSQLAAVHNTNAPTTGEVDAQGEDEKARRIDSPTAQKEAERKEKNPFSNSMPPPPVPRLAPVTPVASSATQDPTRLQNLAPDTFTRPDGQRVYLPAMLPCVFEQPDAPPIVAEVAAHLAQNKKNGKETPKAVENNSANSITSNATKGNSANIDPFDGTRVHQGVFRTFTNVAQGNTANSAPSNVVQGTSRDIHPFDGTRVNEGIFRTFDAPPSENSSVPRNLSVPPTARAGDSGSGAQTPEGDVSHQQQSDSTSREGQLTTTNSNVVPLSSLSNAPGGQNPIPIYRPKFCYMCGKEQTGNYGTVWRGECGHWCHWNCVNNWLKEEENFGFPWCPCGPTH